MIRSLISQPIFLLRRGLVCQKFSSVEGVKDPYYMLGVDKNAEFSEIKKAFYKLASEYHPDKTADDKVLQR